MATAAAPKLAVPFFRHDLGQAELDAIAQVFSGEILTTGKTVADFERQFAKYLGCKHAIGVTSCTGGLHISLLALDVQPGDEVITTPLTFIATATAILQAGATPVFVDVEATSGNIDAEKIEAAITARTRAIMPVHLYGQMCDMVRIRQIAQRHHLHVIEDAAHCIEGERAGYQPGQAADTACFSFYATKNLTCGEGGCVVTNNDELATKLRLLRLHGMTKTAADRSAEGYTHWDMTCMGWKYNMDNIQAAMLLPQLNRLEDNWGCRAKLAKYYQSRLVNLPGLRLPELADNTKHAWHLFPVWIEGSRRDEVLEKLQREQIGVVVNYRAIHLLSYFRDVLKHSSGDFSVAEELGEAAISLPFYPAMPMAHADRVAEALTEILRSAQLDKLSRNKVIFPSSAAMNRLVFITDDFNNGTWETLVRSRSDEIVATVKSLGIEMLTISTKQLKENPNDSLRRIKAFQPEAITAISFNFLLLGAVAQPEILHLGIPITTVWDDPIWALTTFFEPAPNGWGAPPAAAFRSTLGGQTRRVFQQTLDQLKRRVLATWRQQRSASPANLTNTVPVPQYFRELMSAPHMLHCSWDTGHIKTLTDLRLITADQVFWRPVATYRPFLEMGDRAASLAPERDVAFVGNIYISALQQDASWQNETLRNLATEICARKTASLDRSIWDLMLEAIDQLPANKKTELGLTDDGCKIFEFYRFLALPAVNSLVRLDTLKQVRRQVDLFGIFSDPATRDCLGEYPNLRFVSEAHHFQELPQVFATTKVNVCVSNALINQGTPSKFIDCIASGGFGLCDPKDDLRTLFGPIAERIFFRNAEELNEKIDYFLAHPDERREIAETMRRKVAETCTVENLFTQTANEIDRFHARSQQDRRSESAPLAA